MEAGRYAFLHWAAALARVDGRPSGVTLERINHNSDTAGSSRPLRVRGGLGLATDRHIRRAMEKGTAQVRSTDSVPSACVRWSLDARRLANQRHSCWADHLVRSSCAHGTLRTVPWEED